jgi:hypothetical protein
MNTSVKTNLGAKVRKASTTASPLDTDSTTAFDAHPERFVRATPILHSLPGAVWIKNAKVESKEAMIADFGIIRIWVQMRPEKCLRLTSHFPSGILIVDLRHRYSVDSLFQSDSIVSGLPVTGFM